jgi:hypothetical protein
MPAARQLPNFLLIGAMKASTTAFYELAGQHPQIWFPAEKEPHYFTSPHYGETSARQAYEALFAAAPEEAQAVGEASTGYSKLPHFGDTPARIRRDLGAVRLIYLLRDPVERTVSNFGHAWAAGCYPQGTRLADALRQDPILLDASRYARQIRAYREVFGTEPLLVLTTDHLHSDPPGVMREVARHLGVDPEVGSDRWPATLPRSNAARSAAQTLALRARLSSGAIERVRALVPPGVRQRLKRWLPQGQPAPAATAEDRARILAELADDLQDLVELLGDRIACWPSVAALGSDGRGGSLPGTSKNPSAGSGATRCGC